MRKAQIASLAIAMVAALVLPAAADDITLVDVSLGFAYDEDFQAADGGWETTEIPPPPPRLEPTNPSWDWDVIPEGTPPERPDPVNPQWERGVPTSGPGSAYSGTNVWATNLAGPYSVPTCAAIMSPPINLTGATSASVAFHHWVHMDTGATLAFHMGLVFVTTDGGNTLTRVVPDGGYDSANGGTSARACLDSQPSGTNGFSGGPSVGWEEVRFDLDDFTGEEVRIVLGMGSDPFGGGIFAGWYMDAFAVTIDGVTDVEDFETSDGGFTITSTGAPVAGISLPPGGAHSGTKAWATYPPGSLSVAECSGLMSPPIDLTGATSASVSFAHWYEMRELASSAPHAALVFATTDDGVGFDLIEPVGGYTSQPVTLAAARNCLDGIPSGTQAISGGPPFDWEELTFDLDDYAGEDNVRLVLGFRKDTVGSFAGWYVDTWTTTIDGVTTVEDFENSDGGFTVVGVQPAPQPFGWEWGEPTVGPDTGGRNAWATQLHGDYGHFECSWIESPPFQVGPIPNAVSEPTGVVEARLAWNHWFRSNSIYASGVVQVGHNGEYHILEPEGGYPATIGSTFSANEEVTKWQTDCFGMEWEPGDPLLRAYSGLHDALNGPMEGHRADLSAYAGEEVTLRFLFASGWRDVNPATHPGWAVNDVEVETRIVVTGPSPEGLIEDLTTGQDAPGWSSGGPNSEWAWGLVGQGPSGDMAYGTNLNGPYEPPHCGFIESPAVSGSTFAENPTLSFDHWYEISQSGSFAWQAGVVLVSTDGGDTWSAVEFPGQFTASTASRGCVNSVAGVPTTPSYGGFGGRQPEWNQASADLLGLVDDLEDDAEVMVRFVMGSTSTLNTGCTEANPCQGWFIRSVTLGGRDVGPGTPGSLVPELP